MSQPPRGESREPGLVAKSDVANTVVILEANPVTKALKVETQTIDVEIGAVEIKNSTDDTRATVGANGLYVDVQASALPTGAATSAKQLADDHNVTVSNPTADPETGLATSVKQQPPVTTITEYNITLTSADTQYSQALPENTRELRFRCRTLFDVRYSFTTGKVATPTAPYLVLPAGSDYISDNNNLTSTTLYLASAEAGVIVELEVYV